ncbi:MAG: TonB-dependent receptor [Ferruginibacter sp.]
MKKLALILALVCPAIYSFGQTNIKGKIKDQQQNLPSATVLLLASDSAVEKRVVTDKEGEFIFVNIFPGHYQLSSSVAGYSKIILPDILVEEKNIVLPAITLEKATTNLNEVIVKAKKPLFEQQTDRLVVNVQSSITSSGNSILELLQKSPGVVVNRQNNTISMNGKDGVRIMINGKMMQVPLDVTVQMLDGMNAANVEKIELITVPPAKYDAEGNAGIINIAMKGNVDFGTSGSFSLTAGYRWAEGLGGNFNLSHRDKRFSYFLDYSFARNHNLHISKMDRQSLNSADVQSVKDYSHRENITNQQNLNAGIEFKLSNRSLIDFSWTGYRRNWDMTAFTNDNNHVTSDSDIITHMNIHESNIWQSATTGIAVQTKINSKSDISFNLDYLYYHNDNPSNYDNNIFYQQHGLTQLSKIDLNKTTPIRFYIAKADYRYTHSPSFSLDAGIKAVASHLDNNVLAQKWTNGVWTIDSNFTSYSTLREQTGAVYISTKWKIGSEWQINSGLRYEYTHTSISTPTQKDIINRKYGYLFPSLFLKKDFSKENDVQVSYSRRITRPTYNDIAPFVFFWGPNTFSAGNTSLYPAISDAFKIGYHTKETILSLQFSHSKNEISSWQPGVDSITNNLTYRALNLQYLNTTSLTYSRSFIITNWWKVQSNPNAQYQVAQTSGVQHNVKFHLYGFNVNLVNALTLPKEFSVEITGIYYSKSFSGISVYLPVTLLNVGIQKKFGDKGTLRFAIDDILHSGYWKIKTHSLQNNVESYFNYDFNTRYIRLTYTRKFGNNRMKSVKVKSGTDEERGRVNN